MKKIFLICFVIIGIVLVVGCIDTLTKSTSSGYLINPTTIKNGYISSDYKTYALPIMDSFELGYDFMINQTHIYIFGKEFEFGKEYEGDVPSGKRRVETKFNLRNAEKSVDMDVTIFESDSESNFKNVFIANEEYYSGFTTIETKLIGDFSLLNIVNRVDDDNNGIIGGLWFSNKNYLVQIIAGCKDKEICRTEILKVAKEINNKI